MFRFTIRDVLWLTVVVGLACGWWIEHRRAVRQSEELLMRTRQMEAVESHTAWVNERERRFEQAMREERLKLNASRP
jgi:hypothetical protein